MPTESEAGFTARGEARAWIAVAVATERDTHDIIWADVAPIESAVIRGPDPRADLDRRTSPWGWELDGAGLGELARFAAALARAEAEAWDGGDGPTATRAYADRRFLAADRILPWAIPWLDTSGRCYPFAREALHGARDELLRIGEALRTAPALGSGEGLTPPGQDGYAAIDIGGIEDRLLSLLGGVLVFRRTMESIVGGPIGTRAEGIEYVLEHERDALVHLYEAAVGRWARFAELFPGTAQNWRELGQRAEMTAGLLVA